MKLVFKIGAGIIAGVSAFLLTSLCSEKKKGENDSENKSVNNEKEYINDRDRPLDDPYWYNIPKPNPTPNKNDSSNSILNFLKNLQIYLGKTSEIITLLTFVSNGMLRLFKVDGYNNSGGFNMNNPYQPNMGMGMNNYNNFNPNYNPFNVNVNSRIKIV